MDVAGIGAPMAILMDVLLVEACLWQSAGTELPSSVISVAVTCNFHDDERQHLTAGGASAARRQQPEPKEWLARALMHLQLGGTNSKTACLCVRLQ